MQRQLVYVFRFTVKPFYTIYIATDTHSYAVHLRVLAGVAALGLSILCEVSVRAFYQMAMDSSNATFYLLESYHDFKLWHSVLIAASGLLLIASIFISITVTCMRCRKKESARFVHQTRPRKSKHDLIVQQ